MRRRLKTTLGGLTQGKFSPIRDDEPELARPHARSIALARFISKLPNPGRICNSKLLHEDA